AEFRGRPAFQERLDAIPHQLVIIDKDDVERHIYPLGFLDSGSHGGAGFLVTGDGKANSSLSGVMFHAQQPQSAAPSQRVRRVETPAIVPNFQNSTSTCGLYRDSNRRATGMLHRVLQSL